MQTELNQWKMERTASTSVASSDEGTLDKGWDLLGQPDPPSPHTYGLQRNGWTSGVRGFSLDFANTLGSTSWSRS